MLTRKTTECGRFPVGFIFAATRCFARRCHLTEQIGARRRELYANDTWSPADDEIAWKYRRRTVQESQYTKLSTAALAPVSNRRPDRTRSANPDRPIRQTSDRKRTALLDDDGEKFGRQIEYNFLLATNFTTKTPRLAIDSVWQSVCDMEWDRADKDPANCANFLEDFLCLYNRLGMTETISRLASSAIPNLPAIELTRLHVHYLTLTCPPLSSFLMLKEQVSSIDINILSSTALIDLIKLLVFLKHPTPASLPAEGESSLELVTSPEIQWPSKTSLKSFKVPTRGHINAVVMHDLKAKTLSVPMLYRFSIFRPHFLACQKTIEVIDGFLRRLEVEIKQSREIQILTTINGEFRSRLSPVS